MYLNKIRNFRRSSKTLIVKIKIIFLSLTISILFDEILFLKKEIV